MARWLKYEEDVEEAENRWSKPHISTPTLKGWLHLRQNIRDGVVLLDLEAKDLVKMNILITPLEACGYRVSELFCPPKS